MALQPIKLDRRVTFFSPVANARSATGGSRTGLKEEFRAWAAVIYLRGGEAVVASRMQGRQPAVLVMRNRSVMDTVGGDWIVQIGTRQFEVRELPKRRPDAATVEMLVEART